MEAEKWVGVAAREAANIASQFPPDPSRGELLALLGIAFMTGAEFGIRQVMGESAEVAVNLLDGVTPALREAEAKTL